MENNGLFVPGNTDKPVKWLIKDYIPIGGYYIFAAQPGVGKSYLLEALAVDVSFDKQFLKKETMGGDVLVIDEDSNPAVANARYSRFCGQYRGETSKYRLFVLLGQGYRVFDGDTRGIMSLLLRPAYAAVKLLIIDSLTSIAGGKTNLDNTKDATAITNFIQEISVRFPEMTIILVHHISTKIDLSVDDAMTRDNPDRLIMNNTRLVSSSQGIFILASPTKGAALVDLYIRPISRRILLPKPFSVRLHEEEGKAYFTMNESYLNGEEGDLDKYEKRILSEFIPNPDAMCTVKGLDDAMEGLFHSNTLRTLLDKLEDKGYIKIASRTGRGGTHNYALTEKGLKYLISVGIKAPIVSIQPSKFKGRVKEN